MTDDAFEAFWFLYRVSQETLRNLAIRAAGSGEKKSHITYFNEALRGALNRSNDSDEFLKAIEQSLELRFYQRYGDPLPSADAISKLFRELKQHGTLAFMPRLIERVQERRAAQVEQQDTEAENEQ